MKNKAIAQYEDGKLIAKYSSITLASEMNEVQPAHIGKVAMNKRALAGGFNWKYQNSFTGRLSPSNEGIKQSDVGGNVLAVYKDLETASYASGLTRITDFKSIEI